ncbi:uncharacterized protein LOC144095632 [Amblyomma americanum]
MPPVRVMVSAPHVNARRTFTIREGSFSCLTEAVTSFPVLGGIIDLSGVKFQILDGHFQEYVDLAAGDEIPDMAKVTVLINDTQAPGHPPEPPPLVYNNGKAFELPSFGGLHDLILSGKPLTSSVQRKIVDLLFHAMLKYTV